MNGKGSRNGWSVCSRRDVWLQGIGCHVCIYSFILFWRSQQGQLTRPIYFQIIWAQCLLFYFVWLKVTCQRFLRRFQAWELKVKTSKLAVWDKVHKSYSLIPLEPTIFHVLLYYALIFFWNGCPVVSQNLNRRFAPPPAFLLQSTAGGRSWCILRMKQIGWWY